MKKNPSSLTDFLFLNPPLAYLTQPENTKIDQNKGFPMNAAHLHLIVNHVPVLGPVFALLLLSLGMIRRSVDLKKAGLL